VEVRDDAVWDGATAVAELRPPPVDGGPVALRMTAPLVQRDAARELVRALQAAGLGPLAVASDLVRAEARVAGWTGELRGPLRPPTGLPHGAEARAAAAEPSVGAVGALLPGVVVARHGFGRRHFSIRATAADGLRMKVKAPDRDDLVPELIAAALDTALAVKRRFGRMASGVHTVAIDDGAGSLDDHSTAGSTQSGSGTMYLDTSLAFADAIVAQDARMAGRVGVSARPGPPFFAIDGVVAHEYWHNLDATVVATPGVYVEMNRALGEELGVETFEHALRGGEANAPAAWQEARRRIATEVSLYALSNQREATAEMFKLWWCSSPASPPSPLVARFGALVDRFYPPA
jgi:hypothetical protein